MKSKYIVFEGCDYTGKTTLAKSFVEFLYTRKHLPALYTKEPGCPWLASCIDIRSLIINSKSIKSPETYSYLFGADSYEHTTSFIIPMLNQSKIIISDRAMISDFAYRPELSHDIRSYNFNRFKSLNPIIIWCRTSLKTIQDRFAKRSDTNNFETEHVMNKITQIEHGYSNFFYNNQDLNVIEFFSEDNNHDKDLCLFNQIYERMMI